MADTYRIKPLEWEQTYRTLEAKALHARYFIFEGERGLCWQYQEPYLHYCRGFGENSCESVDAGKAACEADWQRRIAACLEPVGWQPIDTAPKDGVAVLLWCPERKNTHKCYWRDGAWQRNNDTLIEEPTHWMPLPDPPKEADRG